MPRSPRESAQSARCIAQLLGLPAPTQEQVAVIEAPLAPVLVVAGAGSGKTETMAGRVLWLVANNLIGPEEILGLTFTRKAAGELASRIRRRLAMLRERVAPDDPLRARLLAAEPTVSTYHSYAAGLVDEHGLRLGVEPASRVLGQAVAWQYAERLVSAYGGDMEHISQRTDNVASAVLSLADDLAEHLVAPDRLRQWSEQFIRSVEALPRSDKRGTGPYSEVVKILDRQRARLELLPLVMAYTDYKRGRSELDFGDQVALAARLAETVPQVGGTERSRYRVVLLDEYQDTGTAQRRLLSSLFGGAGDGVGHPVMAVGDPCQSIYGWRGASAGNLERFAAEFPYVDGQPAARESLTISWRNSHAVLGIANSLSEPLRAEGVPVDELRAASAAPVGGVRCALHLTPLAEADWVADAIAEQWHAASSQDPGPDGPGGSGGAGSGGAAGAGGSSGPAVVRPRPTVAVLCRRRADFTAVADALSARNVPVEVVGLGGLLAEPEVGDVVAMLRVLADPTAGPGLARLLSGPRWRIGPRDLVALGQRARSLARDAVRRAQGIAGADDALSTQATADTALSGSAPSEAASAEPPPAQAVATGPVPADETDAASLVDALNDLGSRAAFSTAGYARMVRLRDELRSLRRRLDQPLPDLVADIERSTLLEIEVAVHSPLSPAQARANLDRFLDVAAEFDSADDRATVSAFVAYLDAAETQERGLEPGTVEVAPDRVQVLTVHGAKGLEWDIVAVVGLSDTVFPSTRATGTWATQLGALPAELRGDAADLPQLSLTAADQKQLEENRKTYTEATRARNLLEEQRLAYVAVTRARRLLLASGYWWSAATKNRKGPSPLLSDIAGWCHHNDGGTVEHWEPSPPDGAVNPLDELLLPAPWPVDPLTGRRAAFVAAAADVRERLALAVPADPVGTPWQAEASLLLAERAERRGERLLDVALPRHLSVSSLVVLRRDPVELARRLRRPVPFKPAPLARRGTAFHAWLEERFGAQRLLDVDELPGAADADAAPDADLAALKTSFLASGWAERRPYDVEVPFEAQIGDVLVRGRMDAVFANQADPVQGSLFEPELALPTATYEVVDWKTGAVPSGAESQAVAVQLAAYRLAWADLHAGGDLSRVSAAFHYVRAGETVRPVDLLDRAGLEGLIATLPTV